MFYLYKRKLSLLVLLLVIYTMVSFWIPYSKKNFIEDIMQNQARLYFTTQSTERIRKFLTAKADALKIPVGDEDITVEEINNEIIYIEMRWNEPVDILFYHTNLHFEPKIFGLIRGFDLDQQVGVTIDQSLDALAELSDSTNRFLRNRKLQSFIKDFFSR